MHLFFSRCFPHFAERHGEAASLASYALLLSPRQGNEKEKDVGVVISKISQPLSEIYVSAEMRWATILRVSVLRFIDEFFWKFC